MCHGSKNIRGKKIIKTTIRKQREKSDIPYSRTNKHKIKYEFQD